MKSHASQRRHRSGSGMSAHHIRSLSSTSQAFEKYGPNPVSLPGTIPQSDRLSRGSMRCHCVP